MGKRVPMPETSIRRQIPWVKATKRVKMTLERYQSFNLAKLARRAAALVMVILMMMRSAIRHS
jgi:hypothetical protein